jgi:hypothetical protein
MNIKHTPGPWSSRPIEFSPRFWNGLKNHLIDCVTLGGDILAITFCPEQGNNGKYNAALMAAAPEMLEALEAICNLEIVEGAITGCTHGDYAWGLVKKALNKADVEI